MPRMIPPMDLMFLLTETPDTPSHVAGLMPFELPAGSGPRYIGDLVDAFRLAKPLAPFNVVPHFPMVGRPSWREVESFDMDYHVQHLALPKPGSERQLHALVEMLHSQMLDRHQPLFQLFVIEGLEHGRFALYSKVHHAIVDGMSAMARVLASLATTRGGKRLPPFYAAHANVARPREAKTLAKRLAASSSSVLQQGLAIRDVSVNLARKLVASLGKSSPTILPFSAPRTISNEPIHAGRSFATLSLPIDELRVVGKRFGATLNDVAVTIVDAGFARYLEEAGKPQKQPLVAMCPMSLRDEGDKTATTKVSAVIAPLGGTEKSMPRRLERVVASLGAAKDEIRRMSKDAALDYAMLLFAVAEGMGRIESGAITRAPANFVLANVPGTRDQLYLGEARALALYPVSMLIGHIGLNVTLASYAGNLDFGIVGNRSAIRDAHALSRHCFAAFAELKREAGKTAKPVARTRTRR